MITIIIGDTCKGGFWFHARTEDCFEDGFPTSEAAAAAAMARFPNRYEIYYRIWHEESGRFLSIPGETAA